MHVCGDILYYHLLCMFKVIYVFLLQNLIIRYHLDTCPSDFEGRIGVHVCPVVEMYYSEHLHDLFSCKNMLVKLTFSTIRKVAERLQLLIKDILLTL